MDKKIISQRYNLAILIAACFTIVFATVSISVVLTLHNELYSWFTIFLVVCSICLALSFIPAVIAIVVCSIYIRRQDEQSLKFIARLGILMFGLFFIPSILGVLLLINVKFDK